MKLQNLIIIFIVIIIPIILIFSYYLDLEANTISMQTDYDEKLMESTKEAIEAFSINTTEWNREYNAFANVKKRNVMNSINTFTTSLQNKLGIGGSSKERILNYIPAMVYIMYDGYYIYTPTYVPETYVDEQGKQIFYYENAQSGYQEVTEPTQTINHEIVPGEVMYIANSGGTTTNIADAKKTYKHILKAFVPYTKKYERYGNQYIVNYSLDNFVRIYNNDYGNVIKEGYILEDYSRPNIEEIIDSGMIEELEEIVAYKDSNGNMVTKKFNYIYNSNGEKRYYDSTFNRYFTVGKDYVRRQLIDANVGDPTAEYKKVLIPARRNGDTEYETCYQLLNTTHAGITRDYNWYVDIEPNLEYRDTVDIPEIFLNEDCSVYNYYVEAYYFNNWLDNTLGPNERLNILNDKKSNVIENINNNLNLSITNYSANSNIDFKLPKITEEDWEQALSNISLITFFQGVKTGLKKYNNYAIATSTENNEFVGEDAIYYMGNGDDYYHRYGCSDIVGRVSGAYKNIDYKLQTYYNENDNDNDENDNRGYYYKHKNGNNLLKECFNCIVNRNKFNMLNESGLNTKGYKEAKEKALARERYILMEKTKISENNNNN